MSSSVEINATEEKVLKFMGHGLDDSIAQRKRELKSKGVNSKCMQELIKDLRDTETLKNITEDQRKKIDIMIKKAENEFYNDSIGGDPIDNPNGRGGEDHLRSDLSSLGIKWLSLKASDNGYADNGT